MFLLLKNVIPFNVKYLIYVTTTPELHACYTCSLTNCKYPHFWVYMFNKVVGYVSKVTFQCISDTHTYIVYLYQFIGIISTWVHNCQLWITIFIYGYMFMFVYVHMYAGRCACMCPHVWRPKHSPYVVLPVLFICFKYNLSLAWWSPIVKP